MRSSYRDQAPSAALFVAKRQGLAELVPGDGGGEVHEVHCLVKKPEASGAAARGIVVFEGDRGIHR
jgi:hypothetical protein